MNFRLKLLLSIVLVCCIPGISRAEVVTVWFEGTIDQIPSDPADVVVSLGTLFEGSFRYDTNAPEWGRGGNYIFYQMEEGAYTFQMAETVWTSSTPHHFNNYDVIGEPSYAFHVGGEYMDSTGPLSSISVNPYLRFDNSGDTAISNMMLPEVFPSDFTSTRLQLIVGPLSDISWTWGTITSYHAESRNDVVPEPCSLALLGIGIAGILAARRLKK